ncbi:MAG: hypothetical protein R3330_00350 [Saprospiraceae bacterium]|nr:hypothetical protein [Saprospiraceae bacterium]
MMRHIRTLIRGTLAHDHGARILQYAGILRFALIFVQGVVLVKAGVPLEIIGQIELVFFVANFLMFYWQNGGRNALLSWVPAAGEDMPDRRKLGTVFVVMHVYGIIAAGLLLCSSWLPFMARYDALYQQNNWIWLSGYVLLTLPAVPILYAYLLRRQYSRMLWYMGVSYTLQVAAVLIPVLTGQGVDVMIRALVCFALLRWLFVLIEGRWFADGWPQRVAVGAFFVFALPLVLHALNSGLMDYVDGWIVSIYFGDEQFALYRYGAKEFPVNALLIGGLLTGLIPMYRGKGGVDAAGLQLEIRKLIRTLFPVNCALILLSPLLYELVYSADFVLSARIFNIYALTLMSRVVINQVYLYVHHHNWVLSLSTGAEIILNVALSILFMKTMGLLGIPLATVVAYTAHKIFLILYIGTRMEIPLHAYLPVKRYVLYFAVMCLCFLAAEIIYF